MKTRKSLVLLSTLAMVSLSGFPIASAASVKQPTYPKFDKNATITWWSWVINDKNVIKAFNKVYPTIHVNVVSMGSTTEFTKLETAIKAGTGAPDVVQIQDEVLPQFINTGGILNISKYVNQYKPYFLNWRWAQVTQGDGVYAVPEDAGPFMLFSRPDVFSKYNLQTPTTWAQFAEDGKELHAKNPKMYMTYFPLNDGDFLTGLLTQGADPFVYTPKGWKIQINSPQVKKIINYWGELIAKGYVKADNDWSPQWIHEVGQGVFASMLGTTWSPDYQIAPYVKPGNNKWQVTNTPQWTSGGTFVDPNWIASSNAVTTQSKNPEAAALFAAWINSSTQGLEIGAADSSHGGRGLFPADKYGIDLPQLNQTSPILASQNPNAVKAVFAKAAATVDPTSNAFSPWSSYLYNQEDVEFTKAAQGKESWDTALDNIQTNLVNFARSTGYNVIN